MQKLIRADRFFVLKHGIVILCHGTAIPCHRIAVPWHRITKSSLSLLFIIRSGGFMFLDQKDFVHCKAALRKE